jgi:hypothetical protein
MSFFAQDNQLHRWTKKITSCVRFLAEYSTNSDRFANDAYRSDQNEIICPNIPLRKSNDHWKYAVKIICDNHFYFSPSHTIVSEVEPNNESRTFSLFSRKNIEKVKELDVNRWIDHLEQVQTNTANDNVMKIRDHSSLSLQLISTFAGFQSELEEKKVFHSVLDHSNNTRDTNRRTWQSLQSSWCSQTNKND